MEQKRISRMVQLLTALQTGQCCTINDLAKISRRSRRTVYRDLRELRNAGIPCRCDKKDRNYSVDPRFYLPPPDLTAREAFALLLLVYKARNHVHFPFKDEALKAALKIESSLPAHIKKYCGSALRHISMKPDPRAPIQLLDKKFVQFQKALLKRRIVRIHYSLPGEQRNVETNVCPHHLVYHCQMWYVLGKSDLHKGVSVFELNRIKEVNVLDKSFVDGYERDPHEYLGRAWSMLPEGTLYIVRLRFSPEVAEKVCEVHWHETQEVTREPDGSAVVEFRVDGLNEIIWWALSYGDQVEVLAPRILRNKIAEIGRGIVQANTCLLAAH